MSEDEPVKAPKKKIRWKRILFFVAFVGIAAGIAYGMSWLNARTYYIVVDRTEVHVAKGRMLPVGHDPYIPPNPALIKAYRKFTLPSGMNLERGERKLDDRVEVDQALYLILREAAQLSLSKDNARTPKLVASYLEHLRALLGTSAQQQAEVAQLGRDALLVEARGNLEQGVKLLQAAADQFVESAKGNDVARSFQTKTQVNRIQEALRVIKVGIPERLPAATDPVVRPTETPTTASSTLTVNPNVQVP
jgi:hypothetical protein